MKLAAETAVQVGGGNDGEGKTLRVSHSPWKSLRDSHIPTAPTTAKLVLKPNPERSFLSHPSNPLSGSSFDWKRLRRRHLLAVCTYLVLSSRARTSLFPTLSSRATSEASSRGTCS